MDMQTHSNLIKYFRACFEEDNRSNIIRNFLSKNVVEQYFIQDEEQLIPNFYPYLPIPADYATRVLKKLKLYIEEKELIYASVFLVGKNEDREQFFSPLFVFPAEIFQKQEFYYVKISQHDLRLNLSVLNDLSDDEEIFSPAAEQIYAVTLNKQVDYPVIANISKILSEKFSFIDTSYMLEFPRLLELKRIKQIIKELEPDQFYLIPASALAIVKKSLNTRGILNELDHIAEQQSLPSALMNLYFGTSQRVNLPERTGFVPSILSQAQQKVIDQSKQNSFLVINGPPGTGKTYTLASLAIEKISLGKSVLITAITDKAIDVVADKIEKELELENIVLRVGKKNYKQEAVKYLGDLLSGIVPQNTTNLSSLFRQIQAITKEIRKLERKFAKLVRKEELYAKTLTEQSFLFKLLAKWLQIRLKNKKTIIEVIEKLYQLYDQKILLTRQYVRATHIKNINEVVSHFYNDLKQLLQALKSKKTTKVQRIFSHTNFHILLKIFPVWLVKLSDLRDSLPLIKELFDYVFFDEATQSDLASPIPALFRAKKIVITGDPRQLRHFSFLATAKQNYLKQKYSIPGDFDQITDYRNLSLIDLAINNAKTVDQLIFLDEHFRSKPAIIQFSNNKFYNGNLRIMTFRPGLTPDEGIKIIKCKGTRGENGYNREEARQVMKILKEITEQEKNLSGELASSIGILSPLRQQVEYLEKQIIDTFPIALLQKHKLRIDTPYGFQGDERDIMILSFALDNNSHASAFRYVSNPNVFNVSITRAKKLQIIIHSLDIEKLENKLLRQYLESFIAGPSQKEGEIKDEFSDQVKQYFEKQGFQVWVKFFTAGHYVDIILGKNGKFLGIDLIGYGRFAQAFDIEKYKILNRINLRLLPVTYSMWKINKDMIINHIQEFFSS